MTLPTILSLFTACTEFQPNTQSIYDGGCVVTSSVPIAEDDPGAVGMSAVDAVALIDGTSLDVTFVALEDKPFLLPTFTTTVTFAVSLAGDAVAEVREVADPALCFGGTVIEAPVTVQAISPEFVEVAPDATLPGLLTWNGTDLDAMVLQHGSYIGVASWIAEDASAYDCTAGGAYGPTEDRGFRFGIFGPREAPWVAGIELECTPGPIATLYHAQGSWQ